MVAILYLLIIATVSGILLLSLYGFIWSLFYIAFKFLVRDNKYLKWPHKLIIASNMKNVLLIIIKIQWIPLSVITG